MAEFDINDPDFHAAAPRPPEPQRPAPPPGHAERERQRGARTTRLLAIVERHRKKLHQIPGLWSVGVGAVGTDEIGIILSIDGSTGALHAVPEKDWRPGEVPLTLEGNPVLVQREEPSIGATLGAGGEPCL